MKIHIFGASGSGTTFLGKEISKSLGIKHFDSDDYYWKKTAIPYTKKNSLKERHKLFLNDLEGLDSWVISGSMDSWSEPFLPLFDIVFFLDLNAGVRVKRLRKRELDEFGERVLPGGDMHEESEFFMKWAMQYEDGSLGGRSRTRHNQWMRKLKCPLIRIINDQSKESLVNTALREINKVKFNFSVSPFFELPDDFDFLVKESKEEGFDFMEKMKLDWETNENQFNKKGEIVFKAQVEGKTIGVCGLNNDPYSDLEVGRVRHLYVLKEFRRIGMANRLLDQIISNAIEFYPLLRLRTSNEVAKVFYEKIGFINQEANPDPYVTHELKLI